jgi:hypothetical protein
MGNHFRVDGFTSEEWQKYGTTFPCYNVHQSWAYGEAHSRGVLKYISRAILFQGDRPVVMAQFRITRIPLIGMGVASALWGPLWRYDEDLSSAEDHLAEFLAEVRNEYGIKQGLHIRFDLRSTYSEEKDTRLAQIFEQQGFHFNPNVRQYRTIILDLSLGLDILHANLDKKWRQELRYSEKAGLKMESGSSVELFDRFRKVYDEMWSKKTFKTGIDLDAIRRTQEIADLRERLLIWVAQHHGDDIGAGVFSVLGNSIIYFLAATSPTLRQKANPGYSIMWASVCKAKELGLRWYDLGGLTDIPDSNIDKFKTRMTGRYTIFPGRFEHTASAKFAGILNIGEKLYKEIRQKTAGKM